ncbi:hypothetical protein CLV63_11862 [Murinocardiopsis flavida]|uniref:Uncharacterized protein n=1 Tax=Murinocardiopsis flavida TaxID=645275 RepID=A0A2P8D515_9ACTN|nr:hypothetical protein [Murinocardiopsis flavida]PSK92303.1 hypothetical protein CLV63_11862 [Murinocardiopsis flavida]
MKVWILLIIGVLLVLMGATWGLQGIGVLPGSVMSGVTLWAVVGPIVAIGGVALIVWGLRSRRS